jgi:hypothetical protein
MCSDEFAQLPRDREVPSISRFVLVEFWVRLKPKSTNNGFPQFAAAIRMR